MSSADSFHRGLERAFARCTKGRQTKKHVQKSNVQAVQVPKADSEINSISDVIFNTIKATTETTSPIKAITLLSDEQYRTTIIEKMINHIKSKGTKQ